MFIRAGTWGWGEGASRFWEEYNSSLFRINQLPVAGGQVSGGNMVFWFFKSFLIISVSYFENATVVNIR